YTYCCARSEYQLMQRQARKLPFLTLALTTAMTLSLAGCSNSGENADQSDPDTPQGAYHAAWRLANATFFDKEKLSNWADWEHKYDGKISDYDQAVDDIAQMYA